jgi:hypothetical protein
MGCLKYLAGIVGLVLLVAGLALIFLAIGPQLNTVSREVGGASITQQIIAANAFGATYDEVNRPDLPVSIDGEQASTNSLNAAPEIAVNALADVSTVDAAESSAGAAIDTAQAEVISEVQSLQVDAQSAQVASESIQRNAVISQDTEVNVVPLQIAGAPTTSVSGQGGAGTVTDVEQRLVELEWPASFRVGGSGTVRLTLRTLPSGQVEVVPEIEDNAVVATPILLSDLYDTHTAAFTARLVAPAFDVSAVTPQTQNLERGQAGTWRWSLGAPDDSGQYVITLGIEVVWTPRVAAGDAPIGPRSIWGQAVQVEANYVFGSITVPQASILGGVLSILGFASQIPLAGEVLGVFWRVLFGRRRKKQRRN